MPPTCSHSTGGEKGHFPLPFLLFLPTWKSSWKQIRSTLPRRMKIRGCCRGWNQELTSLRFVSYSVLNTDSHTPMLNGEILSCRVLFFYSAFPSLSVAETIVICRVIVSLLSQREGKTPQKWQHQSTLIAPKQKYEGVWQSQQKPLPKPNPVRHWGWNLVGVATEECSAEHRGPNHLCALRWITGTL